MKVSSLTLNVAWQITSDRMLLNQFYEHTLAQQWIYFIWLGSLLFIRNLDEMKYHRGILPFIYCAFLFLHV